ncbi:hypothetical protein MHFGQ_23830 [Moorella humiferrea]|uniref:Uncharacterized protein n=1 Tax=Neomoorella humiferrea TaxID=676965 RepID=A0A2T0AJY6_9FIRM|nr:hypothetical protein MOHU_26500 [Moorella humiferrea]
MAEAMSYIKLAEAVSQAVVGPAFPFYGYPTTR